MALITCPECSKQISSAATQCPSCGYPLRKASEPNPSVLTKEPPAAPSVTKPPRETHVIVHHAAQDWRGLAKTSWILIAVACLISIIPVLGFAAWLIAGPVFIAAFVMAIMILSRGGTAQGVVLLGVSMFAAPAFVICAPFVSSLLGLAGVGAAMDRPKAPAVSRTVDPNASMLGAPIDQSGFKKGIIGKWRGAAPDYSTRDGIVNVYPDGRWSFQADESSPHGSPTGYSLTGNQIKWFTPAGASVTTIVNLTDRRMILNSKDRGVNMIYGRISNEPAP